MRSRRVWQEWESRAGDALAISAILWFGFVVVCSAWQCDDAYIIFRTVENFWHGLGLVWNPGERVQSYSSPLWMFAAAICRGITGEVYFSTSVASILLAVATAGLVAFRIEGDRFLAALAVAALSTSAAVVDYATSGLENPLLYLLLILVIIEARRPDSARHLLRLSLLLALPLLPTSLIAAPRWSVDSALEEIKRGRSHRKARQARSWLLRQIPKQLK